jgi:hypothetical protein
MLPTTLGSNIGFKVYAPDQTTLETSKYFQLNRLDRNSWISGRYKTNGSGVVSLFTNVFDQNYSQLIADTNTYQMVALSVLYPKNEVTSTQITETWKISITQNFFGAYQNLAATKIVYLLPNTTNTYNLSIDDMNTSYAARTYAKSYKGNPLTDSLQPYLVPTSDSVTKKLYTLNKTTLAPISGIVIKIYRNLPEGRTYIEQVTTDSAGISPVSLTLGSTYEFELYQSGVLKGTETSIITNDEALYFYLETQSDWNTTAPGIVNILFSPSHSFFYEAEQGKGTISQIITVTGGTIQYIRIYIRHIDVNFGDSNIVLYNTIITTTGSYTNDLNLLTLGCGDSNCLTGHFLVEVWVNNGDKNTYAFINYYPNDGSQFNILEFLRKDIRQYFGGCQVGEEIDWLTPCPTLLLIAIMVSLVLLVVGGFASGFSKTAMGIPFLFSMGMFTVINFVPPLVYLAMLVVGGFILIGARD